MTSVTEPVADSTESLEAELASVSDEFAAKSERPKKRFWLLRFGYRILRGAFCLASLVGVLAVLSAVPLLQLIAFGYLLDVSGRLASGMKLRDSLPNLRRIGQLGLVCTALFTASLPTRLLVHWESVAQPINPDSPQSGVLRFLAVASCWIAIMYLLWAWARGGKVRHYLWPQPIRFLKEGWRWGTWKELPDRLWEFTAALEIPRLFWLGARGFVGTLVWLIPAMIIMAMGRVGTTGLAGLIGFVALVALGGVMLYLPMLQANFAAENRISALFEVKRVRRDFRRAPWAWALAMLLGLVVLPIPLYLLKIEATPKEVVWLPCLVFVAFILPARIAEGLALRRSRRKEESFTKWGKFSRWASRILILASVVTYLVFLFVSSQYLSWDGLRAWVQQHAVLIPIPFLDGV